MAVAPLELIERLAYLAVIALGLVLAGAILVAPDLPLGERVAGLTAIATTFVLVGRLSRRSGG